VVLAAALEVIEEGSPGDEVHVQQIADRAGLSRTVLYRHFADRADLDRAIQAEIVDRVWGEIVPVLSLEGTPVAVVRRIVAAYVGWAAAHPALHRFAEADVPGDGPSPLSRMVEQVAEQIEGLITLGAELLGVPLDDDLRGALDPLVFGLVGAGMASVRRWTAQRDRVATEVFVDLLTQAVWLQIAGMAAARGVVIDPDRPVEELFATEAG
jgi:AcrR family transcriptional regulator